MIMAECSSSSGGGRTRQRQQLAATVSCSFSSAPLVLPISVAREVPPNYCPYPPALAKYEDVVANRKLFMDSLEKLHSTLGTKFMVPIIGGKELDLHRLFVEVTSRGGLEKVIRDRRWKDVTAVFSFPATATNASFVLRKYYVSLLQNYEQIYFFGAQAPSSVPYPAQGSVHTYLQSPDTQTASHKRRSTAGECVSVGGVPSHVGCPVVGVIDGKFEHGYLVTVTVGTEKLKGVLYHTPESLGAQIPHYANIINHNANGMAATTGVRRRRRRKKSEMRKRDPFHPKPNRSGYNFFFAEQHARLKPLYPGKDREISRMIGELWNNLSEADKAVYQERGLRDKERYRCEMEEYRERLKAGPVISNAVPIQQRQAEPEGMVIDVEPKVEMEEDTFPQSLGNETSSDESESDEEFSDKDSEEEASPEATVAMSSSNLVAEDGLELQGNDDDKKENEVVTGLETEQHV